jgi:hypothetical protein
MNKNRLPATPTERTGFPSQIQNQHAPLLLLLATAASQERRRSIPYNINLSPLPPRPDLGAASSLPSREEEEHVATILLRETPSLPAAPPSNHQSRGSASSSPRLVRIWQRRPRPPPPQTTGIMPRSTRVKPDKEET